ncbi:MAG: Nif3-like dinuclear metal center hexameric protein [Oleiphilaceae bacterium]|nr:Nif3-like dinuclear metal center hexameric protein [Oleiphilaceae bacterium]
MTASRDEIVQYCEQYLDAGRIKDYCPNGLQVEGRDKVARIVGGVTASQALIDEAIARQADMILVHHGYFWKGEDSCVTGIKRRRLGALLGADISLLAYHLPLDVHEEVGNNAQLAKLLGIRVSGKLEPDNPRSVGLVGELASAMAPQTFADHIALKLGRQCMRVGNGPEEIKRVAWCTGAAQGMITQAIDLGVDAYISGEISEPTYHSAVEENIHYFAAGHHATERGGVQALGAHLATRFDIEFEFVDIPNPV